MLIRFILVACDGFWKSFENQETCEYVFSLTSKTNEVCFALFYFIFHIINSNLIKFKENAKESGNKDESKIESCCTKLVNEAVKRFSGDNITAILVSINSFLKTI